MGCLNLSKSKGMFSGDVMNYSIEKGNFEMIVLLDDEIVTRLEPGQDVEYHLGSVKGKGTLVITGESAKFSFPSMQAVTTLNLMNNV